MKMKLYWVSVIIIISIFAGILIGRVTHQSTQTTSEKKPLYWIDTMEPTVHYPGPGKSHMGMELTPVYADQEKQTNQNSVSISPTVINNLGVRTAEVKKNIIDTRIEALGYIEPNENKISHIHTYADGWIRNLRVRAIGEYVNKEQIISQLYSPVLINAQEEYLIAIDSNNQSLINASLKKMQTFHIPEQQIQQLRKTRRVNQLINIYSHQNGVVTELNIREGMRVTPETELMNIVDLSSIWMIVQIFEKQSSLVKIGEKAEATLSAAPGKVWKGEVEYIYPQVDPVTRNIKIRLRFDNLDGVLKPNMYAKVIIFSDTKQDVLTVPVEAIIRSSKGDRVIVLTPDGNFQAREVKLGIEANDQVEILSGLTAGEKVVVSGQFLIDSEANLKAGLERLESEKSDAKPGSTVESPVEKKDEMMHHHHH